MSRESKLRTLAIARGYFLEGRSKVELASEHGISRFKVARELQEALDQGLVTITINSPIETNEALSEELKNKFGLDEALVARSLESDTDPEGYEAIGLAGSQLLEDIVTEQDVLGVGWGRTLKAVVDRVTTLPACPVVQLTGVLVSNKQNSMELVRQITNISGGPAHPLYSPLVLPNTQTAAGIKKQPEVKAVLDMYKDITIAVITAGGWSPGDSQLWDVLEPKELDELQRKGAVADSCGHLLTAEGEIVESSLYNRMITISADQLRAIPKTILVAGTKRKAAAISATLHAGLANSIVTDEAAAEELLR